MGTKTIWSLEDNSIITNEEAIYFEEGKKNYG